MIDTLEDLDSVEHALVIGIGGGGDIVSTLPSGRLLELLGAEVTLGGVTWIPVPRDVRPGPRSMDELKHIERRQPRLASVSPDSETIDGVSLPEASIADTVGNEVLVLDITAGVDPLVDSLDAYIAETGIDLVVGVDAGGDALAVGTEPGIKSPLADAVGLAVLDGVSVDAILGVIGFGSDGELTHGELEEAISELAIEDALLGAWGITPRVRREVETILERVETEASRIPIEVARGQLGPRTIRDGRRQVDTTPATPITYYFEPSAVIERSTLVDPVADASDLEAAADALRDRGLTTEFDLEEERLKQD